MMTPGSEELPAGTLVGEYAVARKIGEGTFGSVYAAEHPVIGKRAAVKVLHARYSCDADVVSRFMSEARAVNQIRHPNIIDVFSMGRLPDGRHYLVMELLEGATLHDRLLVGGPMSVEEALPVLRAIAAGLDAAHRTGIAHRDMKPENVFVVAGHAGVAAKLLDFGIAKLSADMRGVAHKTETGVPVGTPLYMAPEQCLGEATDHRVDVYAFGVLVYEILTGKPPFDSASTFQVMSQHINQAPPRLSQATGLPPELDPPLLAMMAKSPDQRPATVGAALKAFVDAATAAGLVQSPHGGGPRAVVVPNSLAYGPTALAVEQGTATHAESAVASAAPHAVGRPEPRAAQSPTPGPRLAVAPAAAPTALSGVPLAASSGPSAWAAGPSRSSLMGPESATKLSASPFHTAPAASGDVTEPGRPTGTLSALSSGQRSGGSTSKGRGLWIGLVGAVVAIGGLGAGYAFFASERGDVDDTTGSESAADASEETEADDADPDDETSADLDVEPEASADDADSEPARVEITLELVPADAEVWRDDQKLDTDNDVLVLPRTTEPVELTVRRAGYVDETVSVVPGAKDALEVTLKPASIGAAPGSPATKPPISSKPPPSDPSLDDLLLDR